MAFRYPVSLELEGRRCVVVGGGPVAERKVRGLLAAGARVTVVAEECTPALERLVEAGVVELRRRAYAPGDLAGAFLAVAATDDRAVNAEVFREGDAGGVLVNAVDDVEHCHFAAPGVVRRGDLTISVSSGGKAPALTRRLREELAARFGPEWAAVVDLLGEVRAEMLPVRDVDFEAWGERWQLALDHDLAALVRAGRADDARELVRRCLAEGAGDGGRQGRVAIVGAGPGDPGLITVRGRELLDRADVVVHDRLVNPSLVEGKETVDVGKRPGRPSVRQERINDLLVELAREGKRVVRLKGGDPFVFGRGAEEAEALARSGVEFEVVPAPSSAVAAPAAAGIPVTDRRVSSSVAFVTGHSAHGQADWRRVAGAVDTVVVLMGVGRLPEIVDGLVEGGMDPSTPAALVERATLPTQRVVRAPLVGLPAAALAAGVTSPATVVVGEVVRVGERIAGGEPVEPRRAPTSR